MTGSPGRTAWVRNLDTPLRTFLRTETGSAVILLAATVAALIWVNLDPTSYAALWRTELSIHLGGADLGQDLRGWVNNGLMTFFFLVAGLEARREFDLGELRQRTRLALPVVAGVGGMLLPIGIYLLFNAGTSTAHGWGAAMSTDTAFALGLLALLGARLPDRLRAFLLTITVVDDVIALVVIALAYSEHGHRWALLVAAAVFAVIIAVRAAGVRSGLVYVVLGTAAWVAMFVSGVEPVVVGLAIGLIMLAYPAGRDDLARATDLFRSFREQPTPELAAEARIGLASAISPNERLQQLIHPWTGYLIVPLFALANAGIPISAEFLAEAFTSPVTLGILVGYVVGKPIGIVGASWLLTLVTRGRIRPPVGWSAVAGGGTIAGIGFTVSLLVASLAFAGVELEQAKLGVLSAALVATGLTWLVFGVTGRLSPARRARALLGSGESMIDLAVPVDQERDHLRGPIDALVTVVEYGDFECPYCGLAEPVVRELLTDFGDVRYVWRHLPLTDVHPRAQLAAEAVEAAAEQGAFWPMHDALLADQSDLTPRQLIAHAERLKLDVDRFHHDLSERLGAGRVAEDVDSADLSGVSGTPTFFVNGRRYHGAFDIAGLSAAVQAARARAALSGT